MSGFGPVAHPRSSGGPVFYDGDLGEPTLEQDAESLAWERAQGASCPNLACWYLVEGAAHDAYTLACDAHIGALRSSTTTVAYVIPEEHPCCWRAATPAGAAGAEEGTDER